MLFYATPSGLGGFTVTQGGANSITLSAVGSTKSAEAEIQVLGGSVNVVDPDIILGAPVSGSSSPLVYLEAGSQLTLNGAIRQSVGGTAGLTIVGGPGGGTLITPNEASGQYTGPVSVNGAAWSTGYITPGNILLRNGASLTYTGSAGSTATGGITFDTGCHVPLRDWQRRADRPLGQFHVPSWGSQSGFPYGVPGVLVTGGAGTLILDYNTPNTEYMKISHFEVTGGNTILQSRAPCHHRPQPGLCRYRPCDR